ncbi:MAG: hypothetical protein WBA63_10710 [Thermomicrobiales bacterium]
MTVSPALTVAFAVKDGSPSDVREWVSVELAEFFSSGRRGFMVSTEALRKTPESLEIATFARGVIVDELRRTYQMPPDVALGHAFAAANAAVHERARDEMTTDPEHPVLIGAAAVVFDDHVATIAHVPPSQLILIEDGLVYAVPELGSWLPNYADPNTDRPNPEPLGFGSRVAPVIAQTDLRAGDTILLCSTVCGQAFATEMHDAGASSSDLAFMHGRDPDKILDVFRDLVVDYEIENAAVAVTGFAPLPDGSQIRTMGDIGRRVVDIWRQTKVQTGQLLPAPRPGAAPSSAPSAPAAGALAASIAAPAPDSMDGVIEGADAGGEERRTRWRARTLRVAERLATNRESTWEQPTLARQIGVPGAHGVQAFRGSASEMGEETWRNHLPRLPAGGALVWILVCLLLVGGALGGMAARERWFVASDDNPQLLAAVDQRILDAREMSDPDQADAELVNAQRELNAAREGGAAESDIAPRQQAITERRDELHNVVRLDDVTRIGGLPEDLQKGKTRVVRTPGGIFLVSGSLFQLQPDEKKITRVLEEGSTVKNADGHDVTVGDLYGVAYDTEGLYATDGSNVFIYGAENKWQAVALGEINEQGPWPAGPIGSFSQSLYILEAEYRNIYRFDTSDDAKSADAVDWVLPGSRADLNDAVDMAIDGNIYVLLSDGRVLTLYRGDILSEVAPTYLKDADVRSIFNGASTGYLYVSVVDGSDGRIVAFDHQGQREYQLELPAGFSTQGVDVLAPFEKLQAITIDEDSGTIYLINGDAIWTARYPLPALPKPATTPGATPQT